MWFYSIRGVISGATVWVQPTWVCQERGGVPWWVVPTQLPLSGRSWLQKFLFII